MTKFYREQKVELFYFTSPFCYHCWDHEPQLNRFLQSYGDYVDLHIIMGSNCQTLGGHGSSDFPCKVFRVFSASYPSKSLAFLKLLRSVVFNEKKDLDCEDNLRLLITSLGERAGEILERSQGEEGRRRLEEDEKLARRFEVDKLPSFALVHQARIELIHGHFEEKNLEQRLEELLGFKPEETRLRSLEEELRQSFRLYPRDFQVLYGLEEEEMLDFVEEELDEKDYRWVNFEGGIYLEAKHERL